MKRRDFMRVTGTGMALGAVGSASGSEQDRSMRADTGVRRAAERSTRAPRAVGSHKYNAAHTGENLNRVAFPLGGIGAGMVCLEGTGALSHVSVRNRMDFFNEPQVFAALCVKGSTNVTRVVEGPIPDWKYFGRPNTGRGAKDTSYGFPRFRQASFLARFPFATVTLEDQDMPVLAEITGWSPFVPGNADDASLPVAALEYRFQNRGTQAVDAVFSFNSRNFIAVRPAGSPILATKNGFIFRQEPLKEDPGAEVGPESEGAFAVWVDDDNAVVDHSWLKGSWRDSLRLAWNNVEAGALIDNPPGKIASTGASLFVPFKLRPGQAKTIRLKFAWYVPATTIRRGVDAPPAEQCSDTSCCGPGTYVPWYVGRFKNVRDVKRYWDRNYDRMRQETKRFTDALYDSTLPGEVMEAVTANLTILKSPTVLRVKDGRFWAFEGCNDDSGCCIGTCTHVWNYAQAVPHLFPGLERTLRETEFTVCQNDAGHQTFRASLPIRHAAHGRHAASDGQLGGIMKMYREWRISGDTAWLKKLWPRVKQSLDYAIQTWDPRHRGLLEEPHHNTYDIEFWGPDGMCTSFYLGALTAAIEMGAALGDDMSLYKELLERGRKNLEKDLYDGEYFYQRIMTGGLDAVFVPINAAAAGDGYKDLIAEVNAQGPKYQYGTGCISDGVLGFWIARMCGLDAEIVDDKKIRSNLAAIHKYNLRHDLSKHANPQRPSYALGDEGGLLLCSWPKGGDLAIPFVYSDEVWTGIEYQVASHLMIEGMVEEGLEIVRLCRDRYDGVRRNPFNEYECGHWYARALASYGLLQGLTGVRYDALEKTLHIDSRIGDSFRSFLCTEHGFGTVGLRNGKPFLELKHGAIEVSKVLVSGKKMRLS